ncbi:MAG: aldo/keto reductase [Lachnospiraceae bacterium]|nr:aldo/keto reductase [Lachnospiraceae bacterium]
METFRLSNGYEIPVIGYGTYPQKESLPRNLVNAYRAGYRLFDTSDNYDNEAYLGEGLTEIDRNDCVVITKYSRSMGEVHFADAFKNSRDKLKSNPDIYLLHWPYPFLWKYHWRQMEKLYLAGEVKAIGVCNFEVDKLEALLRFCKVPPVIDQIERHPLFQQKDIVEYCDSHDIRVMSYSPVARGNKELMESPVLKEIAGKYNKSIGQIILRWDIDTGTIPIPGASGEDHIRDNIDIFDFELTDEELGRISELDSGVRIRFAPKTRFTLKQKIQFLIKRLILILIG